MLSAFANSAIFRISGGQLGAKLVDLAELVDLVELVSSWTSWLSWPSWLSWSSWSSWCLRAQARARRQQQKPSSRMRLVSVSCLVLVGALHQRGGLKAFVGGCTILLLDLSVSYIRVSIADSF